MDVAMLVGRYGPAPFSRPAIRACPCSTDFAQTVIHLLHASGQPPALREQRYAHRENRYDDRQNTQSIHTHSLAHL